VLGLCLAGVLQGHESPAAKPDFLRALRAASPTWLLLRVPPPTGPLREIKWNKAFTATSWPFSPNGPIHGALIGERTALDRGYHRIFQVSPRCYNVEAAIHSKQAKEYFIQYFAGFGYGLSTPENKPGILAF